MGVSNDSEAMLWCTRMAPHTLIFGDKRSQRYICMFFSLKNVAKIKFHDMNID